MGLKTWYEMNLPVATSNPSPITNKLSPDTLPLNKLPHHPCTFTHPPHSPIHSSPYHPTSHPTPHPNPSPTTYTPPLSTHPTTHSTSSTTTYPFHFIHPSHHLSTLPTLYPPPSIHPSHHPSTLPTPPTKGIIKLCVSSNRCLFTMAFCTLHGSGVMERLWLSE